MCEAVHKEQPVVNGRRIRGGEDQGFREKSCGMLRIKIKSKN